MYRFQDFKLSYFSISNIINTFQVRKCNSKRNSKCNSKRNIKRNSKRYNKYNNKRSGILYGLLIA